MAKEKDMTACENDVTVYEQAAQVIRDKMVQFNMDSGEFIVNTNCEKGVSCVVKLVPATFSSEACSCPGTAVCLHIIAAKIASNCTDISSKRPTNSST